jgi:hypothetical protein
MNKSEIVLDVASIGFGVQSTGIALMSGLGLIPKADKYYFSELRETQATIDYIGYINPILKDMGINVDILKPDDIYEHILNWKNDERVSMIPLWFLNDEGKSQPLKRQCTSDFKIEVIASKIRVDLNTPRLKRNSIRIWQGISIDEERRAKKSPLYTNGLRVNHYPFIGKYGNITYPDFIWKDYSRTKIIDEIFKKNGFIVPPKSSCFFCPFHDIEYWYEIFIKYPKQWELACVLDDTLRNYNYMDSFERGPFYLYKGLLPLRKIDFDRERKTPSNQLLLSGCNSGFCFV